MNRIANCKDIETHRGKWTIHRVALTALLLLVLFAQVTSAQQYASIGKGSFYVLGIGLVADPSEQTVPINTATGVNARVILPDLNLGNNVPALPADFLVMAELSGPGIVNSVTITARPGEMLMIPPLPQKGKYILDKIRLMIGDKVVLYAEPSAAVIDTIEKLLITQVTSRPLSIDEIENLGIGINPENFTAYNFTVGFATESALVKMELPVVINYRENENESVSLGGADGGGGNAPSLSIPNLHVKGFKLEPFEEDFSAPGEIPPITGAIVIPGNIAFLNQFFEVMLLVTNNAPSGTPLVVTDISSEISLPAGSDNIPQTNDDPLRIAKTDAGALSVVPVINKDGGKDLSPQGSGEAKFLVEGLKEGTHQVNIDITGTLKGLPSGPVKVKGKAVGTVLVRNPYFSLTFGQPDVVREGEEYSLFVTVNNTSDVDANLVTLNLFPNEIFGATMISDSDPETPLGAVKFRTIKAHDSAVGEYRFIARKTGRITSAAFQGDEGGKGVFNLRTGIGEKGIPLSPDTLILSSYVKHLPGTLLYEAMRVLGLAHSVSTAPVLPAGVTRIPRNVVAQRAYELTEAGLRIKMGEPLKDAICGLLLDWSGDIMSDQGFEDILMTTDAGRDFASEAAGITGGSCPVIASGGPKAISVMQLSEADLWERGRVVAVLFDRKIDEGSTNNPANYKLLYRTLAKELRNPPKSVKILPGKRIIEVLFQATVSPFLEYDLVLSGIKGRTLSPQEPDPARLPVVTTLTSPGGIVLGTVRRGDSDPIPYTEVFLWETFKDEYGYPISVITNRTATDSAGNYQIDYVAMGSSFRIESSDPQTGQKGSISSRIIMDRQRLKLDLLLLGLGTVTGEVVKAEDQSPVKGAVVKASSLTTSDTFSATSDADGKFTIRMVPVGNLNLSAEAGLYKGSVAAQVYFAGTTSEVTVPVYRIDVTGSVQGRVFEADGKTPVIGVPIIVSGTNYSNWKYTDSEGSFFIEGVPSGQITLNTFRQETGEKTVTHAAVTAGISTTVNLVLPGTATIIGTVYDYKGLPVSGAEVLAGVTLVITDKNGNFAIERVPIGSITVSAAIPNTNEVGNVKVDIGSPGETVRVSITLSHFLKGTIQGYVKDAYGRAKGYQEVIIWDGSTTPMTTLTDGSGFFKKEVLIGDYTVRIVNADRSDGDLKPVRLLFEGQTATVELRFKGFGRITGTVYQPDGVSPTVASVYITKTYYSSIGTPIQKKEKFVSDQRTKDGLSGMFVIDKVQVGDFRLEVSNAFYSQPVVRIGKITSPDETVNVDIVLMPTSSVRGQVFLASGDRAGAGLAVNLSSSRSNTKMQVHTDEEGKYEFTLVPPEGFTLDVFDPLTGNFGVAKGSVETGDEAVVDINILGKGTVRAKVIDGAGNPIVGGRAQLNSGSPVAYLFGGFPKLTTDQNGEAVFTNVPEGDFSVAAEDPLTLTGGRSGGRVPEDLAEINATIVIAASGSVSGAIYTADGTGKVPYAQVKLSMSGRPDFFTTSDAEGAYSFTYVPLGSFKLEVFHPATGRAGTASGRIDYNTEALTIDIDLIAQGTVEGYVFTASGAVVPKARVEIRSLDLPTYGVIVLTSNLEGRFRASGIPEGRYSVKALEETGKISGMAEGRITFEGEIVGTDVYLQATGTIYGKVFSANGMTPIAYAQADLSGSGYGASTVTDYDGNYSFVSVPLGTYKLTAKEQNGFDGGQISTTLDYEGQTNRADIVFIGTGNVVGKVVKADGSPLDREAVLTLKRTGLFAGVFTGYADLSGNFAFYGIPAGDFSISAKIPGSILGGAYNGTLSGDGTTLKDIVIVMESSGEIYGRVLKQEGATPAKDALATCILTTSGNRRFTLYASSGEDGSFSFKDVPLGLFTVSVIDYLTGGSGKGSGKLTDAQRIVDIGSLILDETAPSVLSTSPASGSSQVSLDSTILITFSEPVDSYSINATNVKVTGGASPISGSLTLSGDRKSVVFTPSSALPEFTTITVTVKSVRDDMGKTMEGTFISTFTTADITAPRVVSARLIKGAFVAEFSEAVFPESGTFSVKYSATGEAVAGALTFSSGNTVATLYPSAALPDNLAFDLVISDYKDSFGNVQAADFRATYMTGDKAPPVVILTASSTVVIEGTPVVITAVPQSSPDLYTVDFRVNGSLVKTVYREPFSITIIPIGNTTVTATPTDCAGNLGGDASITVSIVPNAPPVSTVLSPADGSVVGTGRAVTVKAQAADDLGLKEIELRVRSADISITQVYPLASNTLSAIHDFSFTIPSTSLPGNDLRVEVVARDIRGLEGAAAAATLHTEDKTPPTAKITSFTQGFHVAAGQTVPVTVYASDNWAVSRIDFKTEGGLVVSESKAISPPSPDATVTFNLTVPANYVGGTKITVAPSAVDQSGNVGYAPKITLVTDDATPPTVEVVSPTNDSTVTGRTTVKITAKAADNDAVDRVEFFVDGKLFAMDKFPANELYDASFIAPLTGGTTLTLSAKSYDVTGNGSEIRSVSVKVVKDDIAPSVTMLSNPASMKFAVGHNVSIIANVADNVGVSSAELFVNDRVVSTISNPSSTYLTFTYIVENLIPQGAGSIKVPLEVKATDLDGNKATSAVFTIEIVTDNPPAVTILSPRQGQNVLGGASVRLEAKAADDFGVGSMELKVDRVSLRKATGAAISSDYDVPAAALGSKITVEAIATDTLGNSVSKTVEVNVPLRVSLVSTISTGGEIIDAAFYSGYVYVLEKGAPNAFVVIDVKDASQPRKTASLPLEGSFNGLRIFEGVVYVYGSSGVISINASDPSAPGIINTYTTPAPVLDISFRDGYAYCALGQDGILILEINGK